MSNTDNIQEGKQSKMVHVKPSLYAYYFLQLKEIALLYGYNLVVHGSMNRDLDLIAIPWRGELKPYTEMVKEFCEAIGGWILDQSEEEMKRFSDANHGRINYIININRRKEFTDEIDHQYYLDITIIPYQKKL